MKIIDVLNMMAKGEIEDGSILKVVNEYDELYRYEYHNIYRGFKNEVGDRIEEHFFLDNDFLNFDVKLIPPKEKKYLIKVNIQWFDKDFSYLNYDKQINCVIIYTKVENITYKTHFTKSELQSIKPIREFLDDIGGKYELIEVKDNEVD